MDEVEVFESDWVRVEVTQYGDQGQVRLRVTDPATYARWGDLVELREEILAELGDGVLPRLDLESQTVAHKFPTEELAMYIADGTLSAAGGAATTWLIQKVRSVLKRRRASREEDWRDGRGYV